MGTLSPTKTKVRKTVQGYLAQESGTCCFVWAVANYCLHRGMDLPDLDTACHITKCNTGATISMDKVVDYFGAGLCRSGYREVLDNGGIIILKHPIVNMHAAFVYPLPHNNVEVCMVNSWLGPNIMCVSKERLIDEDLIYPSPEKHWYALEPIKGEKST